MRLDRAGFTAPAVCWPTQCWCGAAAGAVRSTSGSVQPQLRAGAYALPGPAAPPAPSRGWSLRRCGRRTSLGGAARRLRAAAAARASPTASSAAMNTAPASKASTLRRPLRRTVRRRPGSTGRGRGGPPGRALRSQHSLTRAPHAARRSDSIWTRTGWGARPDDGTRRAKRLVAPPRRRATSGATRHRQSLSHAVPDAPTAGGLADALMTCASRPGSRRRWSRSDVLVRHSS
jgi:hypothetical protein